MRKHFMGIALIIIGVALPLLFTAQSAKAADTVSFEEAYGATAGLGLYNIQVILGLSADAFEKEVYAAEQMNDIVGEQKTILTTLSDYMVKLQGLKTTSAADKKSLKDMNAVATKLTETADSLLAYVADSSVENAEDFQTKRKASYAALADLLGLEK
jgi:hypothetical protein